MKLGVAVPMSTLTRAIQGVILFSTALGIPFLYEVYPVLPTAVFYSVAFGWVLFVVDSILTFVRPRASYYMGLVLAAVAFLATVSQPAHFALINSGNIPAAVTFIVGPASEIILIVLVIVYAVAGGRKDPWALSGSPQG